MSQPIAMIIAGSTGLVGQSTLLRALKHPNISTIYSISRQPLDVVHPKISQLIETSLTIPVNDAIEIPPTVGVIALGTTIKQAGSKANLYAIDVELVIKVAKQFHSIGVRHLIIVSSIGASINSASHYLRCKGEMELAIQQLNFSTITFLQPGPLAGARKQPRRDEKILQRVMKFINPLMRGKLANYIPIQAADIAQVIIHLVTRQPDDNSAENDTMVNKITSSEMLKLMN